MKHYVGFDVAMKQTAICIVDERRQIVREGRPYQQMRRRMHTAAIAA